MPQSRKGQRGIKAAAERVQSEASKVAKAADRIQSAAPAQKSKPRMARNVAPRGPAYQNMKSHNAYAQALADPFRYGEGVRIPDFNALPSATFTLVDRRTITVSSSGIASIQYGMPMSGIESMSLIPTNLTASPGQWFNGVYGSTATMTLTDVFNAASGFAMAGWQTSGDENAVNAIYSHVRLVSGGVNVTVLGALDTTQGKISAAFFPKGQLHDIYEAGVNKITLTDIENCPGSCIVPCNKVEGAWARYSPADMQVCEYVDILDSVDLTVYDQPWAYPGAFAFVVSGAPAGVVVQISAVFHYEAFVRSNGESFGLETMTPSPVDPLALAQGFSVAARTASTGGGTPALTNTSTRGSASRATTAVQQQSFTDMLMNGAVRPTIDILGKGISTLGGLGIGKLAKFLF